MMRCSGTFSRHRPKDDVEWRIYHKRNIPGLIFECQSIFWDSQIHFFFLAGPGNYNIDFLSIGCRATTPRNGHLTLPAQHFRTPKTPSLPRSGSANMTLRPHTAPSNHSGTHTFPTFCRQVDSLCPTVPPPVPVSDEHIADTPVPPSRPKTSPATPVPIILIRISKSKFSYFTSQRSIHLYCTVNGTQSDPCYLSPIEPQEEISDSTQTKFIRFCNQRRCGSPGEDCSEKSCEFRTDKKKNHILLVFLFTYFVCNFIQQGAQKMFSTSLQTEAIQHIMDRKR